MTSCFEIGAVCQSMTVGEPSGDAWTSVESGGCLTVVVVDGVGHGLPAHEAAAAAIVSARAALERDPLSPLPAIMQRCHAALRGTRGAALALCRFEPAHALASYCGIGNTAFLRHPNRTGLGVSLPGIVGWNMRSVRVFDTSLSHGDLFAFHTDGIASEFLLEDYSALPVQKAAEQAIKRHGKLTDDATVVLVRYARP